MLTFGNLFKPESDLTTIMKIKSVTFVKSVASLNQLPKDDLPHIAFAGRSNVGKSSLLNTLFNRKKMALVSSTPGKTRLLNFFLVNEKVYFVDLPGYGYAKVSHEMKQNWQYLVEQYLLQSRHLRCVVLLVDIRHPIQASDLQLVEWLTLQKIPAIIVGTKADKLSNNKLNARLALNLKSLAPYDIHTLLPFSATTGKGKQELLKEITKYFAS